MNRDDGESELLDVLGFCGCGRPEEALDLVRRVLANRKRWRALPCYPDFERHGAQKPERDAISDELNLLLAAETPHDPLGWILLYHLDHLGLLEHGGSAFGSWTTEKGEEVLLKLEAWALARGPLDQS